jgi:putative transposase
MQESKRASAPAYGSTVTTVVTTVSAKAGIRTFFVTSRTYAGKSLFQTERMAALFTDVLRAYTLSGNFKVREFVVMPNHVHLLITGAGDMSIEKAVQMIKGGFSYRAKKELELSGEIWQRGFSDVQIKDEESYQVHRSYIYDNPLKAGLVGSPQDYMYGSLPQRLKDTGAEAHCSNG